MNIIQRHVMINELIMIITITKEKISSSVNSKTLNENGNLL